MCACCSVLENLECSRTHHINLVCLRTQHLFGAFANTRNENSVLENPPCYGLLLFFTLIMIIEIIHGHLGNCYAIGVDSKCILQTKCTCNICTAIQSRTITYVMMNDLIVIINVKNKSNP